MSRNSNSPSRCRSNTAAMSTSWWSFRSTWGTIPSRPSNRLRQESWHETYVPPRTRITRKGSSAITTSTWRERMRDQLDLVNANEGRSLLTEAFDDARQCRRGRGGPGVQQHDRPIAAGPYAVHDRLRHRPGSSVLLPIQPQGVPVDVPVAQSLQSRQHARIVMA